MQKQLKWLSSWASRGTETRGRRRRKKKIFWQLTHYLCRYPPVPSFFPLSLFLFLSICQWRDKIPLSWRLSRDYPGVPGEGGRGAEMPHYRCSKGYSKFNGPEVEQEGQEKERGQWQVWGSYLSFLLFFPAFISISLSMHFFPFILVLSLSSQ